MRSRGFGVASRSGSLPGSRWHAGRRRYFEIARGSALECAAIQGVLVVGNALDEAESRDRKTELDRMAAMLSRLGGRGYQVREGGVTHGQCEAGVDPDPDSDSDQDEVRAQAFHTPDRTPPCVTGRG